MRGVVPVVGRAAVVGCGRWGRPQGALSVAAAPRLAVTLRRPVAQRCPADVQAGRYADLRLGGRSALVAGLRSVLTQCAQTVAAAPMLAVTLRRPLAQRCPADVQAVRYAVLRPVARAALFVVGP